jgi:oxygen-dependent protoporphyrinogen oxidase
MKVAVLGAGIAGLAAAFHLSRRANVTVFEAAPRPGGNIRTEEFHGCLVEWGPNGFLDNEPATLTLARDLGIENRLVRARPEAARRFVVREGRLRELPQSPKDFLRSDCLSPLGKLRVALERFVGRSKKTDQSVLEFAERRLGREAARVLVDAFVTGVFAGDPARLSLASAFPKLHALERDHGSLLAGARGGGFGPKGVLTSFDRGLGVLVETLAARVDLRLGAPAERIERGAFDRVVCTIPAPRAARLLPAELGALVARIPTAPVAVVAMVFAEPMDVPDAFGFLAPRSEGLRVLGTLYDSSIFPGRAPRGLRLFRAMLGGRRDPEAVALEDGALLELVARDLRRVWGFFPEPRAAKVIRHPLGIAQYELGHGELLAAIERVCPPWLALTGSSYRGVSINACVREAASLQLAR